MSSYIFDHRSDLAGVSNEVKNTDALDLSLFTSPKPRVSDNAISTLLREQYGLVGRLTTLASERDLNLLVSTDAGRFVLKISNAAEPKDQIAVNSRVLKWLEVRSPQLISPRLVSTRSGEDQVEIEGPGVTYIARVLTYLDGTTIADLAPHKRPLKSIGECVGQVGHALNDFTDPRMKYDLIWNSARVDKLRPLLNFIGNELRRTQLAAALDRFETETLPRLTRLPKQMIHNDVNLGNTIYNRGFGAAKIGVFDFGDLVYAPAINDLAVAAAYLIFSRADVNASLLELIRGYAGSKTVTVEEVDALPSLIVARILTTILVTEWRAVLFPENANYILRNNEAAWQGLEIMQAAQMHLSMNLNDVLGGRPR